MSQPVIEFRQVEKLYEGTPPLRAVDGVSFQLERGSFSALIGPSGSGKTTILNLASGLDQPSQGQIHIAGQEISRLSTRELSRFRARHLGFVFQAYNLFPVLTVLENVEYTSLIRGDRPPEARARALRALDAVGLSEKTRSTPGKLSGGQQQRVAVARALASQPDIIFADEPTANLDSKTAFSLIDLFEELNREFAVTFLFSTHDPRLVERVGRRLEVQDGKIVAN